ncbi:MAG: hypothetical protein HY841_13230 [Bacteroidetes bacterium]|nr:hypothetical protein [Bacteroidota bacterium]
MGISKDIKKENNFKVPENYFDYLPQEIMERIHSTEVKQVFSLNPALSFASLAILSAMAFLLIYFSQNPPSSQNEYVLTQNDIQYIIDNSSLYNIDDNSITEEYLSTNSATALTIDENVSEDEIKTFLEENINTNTIINDL